MKLALTLLIAGSGALRLPHVARAGRMSANSAGLRMSAINAALPKAETGVAELLKATPEADGRGILLAVLDTGCDLAAAGLLKTSDGKPKYVDFIDCTGGGDIDTSKVVERDSDGHVMGISGRLLRLGTWADGADEIRVGTVRLYELLPRSVLARVKRERKAAFSAVQHAAITAAQRALADVPAGAAHATKRKDAEAVLEELKKLMEGYHDAGPLLDVVTCRYGGESSPSFRVVVSGPMQDGAEDCDLSGRSAMAPYREAQEVGDLGFGSALSYCVQVYEDGKVTSLVVDSGSHGTHVAGIAAAYFEDAPEKNGVAPGAQVLACKIGDSRLGSAETGTGLVRALIAAKAAGCDLINLSYGEPFYQADAGRVSQTFNDAVRKWGMTVFTSAGNDGPALSTLGAPGHLSAPITVGAYISPPMMAGQYSMLPPTAAADEPEATSYSFSSRGPTPDGWLPTLCAPGGAIAPVPRHTLQGKAQYHGTSMSSPNACGVAAIVLSALRASGVHVGPIELRRALENAAVPVETSDSFAQGHGLINAPAAVAYATAHHGKAGQDVEFQVSVPSRANARGLYLRDPSEMDGPLTFGVHVRPHFEHAGVDRSNAELEQLLGLEIDLKLVSTAPWVVAPSEMVLTSGMDRGGQSFAVRLDPSGLPPGAHFARVQAVDAGDPGRGPLFSLPISVIVPHAHALPAVALADAIESGEATAAVSMADADVAGELAVPTSPAALKLGVVLPAGAPVRRFLVAPDCAEWATFKLVTRGMRNGPHSVIVHAVPSARGDVPNGHLQVKKMLPLREYSEELVHVPVKGGSTLELCMQLSWLANPNPVEVDVEVEWHSYAMRGAAMASDRPLRLGSAHTFARLEVGAPLCTERLSPKAELVAVERALRPKKHAITAGSAELDVLPPSDAELAAGGAAAVGVQIHQMVLTYEFELSQADKAEEALSVVPRVQSLHDQLYDSPLDSMLWRLESSDGAALGFGGAMHDCSPIKLRKGRYTLKLLLRHPSPAQLEALKELPMQLRITLPKAADCKVFSERGKASSIGHGEGVKPIADGWLRRGAHRSLYVAAPTAALPAWVGPGDALVGSLSVDSKLREVTKLPLVWEVPPAPAKAPSSEEADGAKADGARADGDEDEDEPSAAPEDESEEAVAARKLQEDVEALDKALLEAKLARLKALRTSKADAARYDALAAPLRTEQPKHLPLLLELLAWARRQEAPAPDDAGGAKAAGTKAAGVKAAGANKPAATADGAAAAAARTEAICEAADALLASSGGPIDPAALAQFWGVATDDEDKSKAAKEQKKEMESQRKALRLALFAKAAALAPEALAVGEGAGEGARGGGDAVPTPFVAAVREMKRWVTKPEDLEEADREGLALVLAKYELAFGRTAGALATLHARDKAKPSKAVGRAIVTLYQELGWGHWARNAAERLEADYPAGSALL